MAPGRRVRPPASIRSPGMEPRGDVPRFSIGWVWWVAGGIASLLAAIASLARARSTQPAYLAGVFLGSALTTLLLAVLAGWIVWRIAGRSRRAGHVAFVVMLLLTLAGSAVGVAKHALAINTVVELGQAQERRLAELMTKLSDPLTPAEIKAALTALDAYFDPVAARAVGDGKSLVAAVRAHHRDSATHLFEYAVAFRALEALNPTDFAGAGPATERTRRRVALQAVLAINERYRRFQAEQTAALRARIAALPKFDRFADDILDSAARPGLLIGPLDAQAAFASQLLETYDFLDRHEGQWSVTRAGTLAFTHDQDAARFQERLDALGRLVEDTRRTAQGDAPQ
jgi:uncharacterized membrane protein